MIATETPAATPRSALRGFNGAARKPASGVQRPPARAQWLRDTTTGALAARRAGIIESRDDVRRVWDRVSALALDFIQNSGKLRGAVDQVLADTVGTELKLNARPDLSELGYSADEAAEWARMVERRWRQWAWNPAECDSRGKFTLPQLADIALRYQIAYGEITGIMEFWPAAKRKQYGVQSGLKVCLVPPHRLVRDTNEVEGIYQGVVHDTNGRPTHYRFRERVAGIDTKRDYPARDAAGRPVVIHLFDPNDAADVRGLSVIAAAMRTYVQSEQLGDATLATAILQTLFAATLTSPSPSKEAFEAIEDLGEIDAELKDDFLGYFGAVLDRARDDRLSIDNSAKVNHLGPGEALQLHTAATPHDNYLPFKSHLDREMARTLGVTASSYTMNHDSATYSSVRMESATIWPVVVRRRERFAATMHQIVYENWLDEGIGLGRIPLRGGYRAFQRYRDAVCWAEWQGPARPTADDFKSAKASTERLQNGTSTLKQECAELGLDVNDVIATRAAEKAKLEAAGLPVPFAKVTGGQPVVQEDAEGEQEEAEAA